MNEFELAGETVAAVAAELARRYGRNWRGFPELPMGSDLRKGRDPLLDLDRARNHLREVGFPAALEAADVGAETAHQIALQLWAPRAVDLEPLVPVLKRSSDQILAAKADIGTRAGLDALLLMIATADEVLEQAHGDLDTGPVHLASRWKDVQLLCGAVIARAIAAAGSRVDARFPDWDVLGFRVREQAMDAEGNLIDDSVDHHEDYVLAVGTAATNYLLWQQRGVCRCLPGCARSVHRLRKWTPGERPPDTRKPEGAATAELSQWFWALMIGPQPHPENGEPKGQDPPRKARLDPHTFEANLFYRDFVLRLASAADVRVEDTMEEICAHEGCPSLIAARRHDEPAPKRAQRGEGRARECCCDPGHPLRYSHERFRDYVLRKPGFASHDYFAPLRFDRGRSRWVVDGQRAKWLTLPFGSAKKALEEDTRRAGLEPDRLALRPRPWRRDAAVSALEGPLTIDPRVRLLVQQIRAWPASPGNLDLSAFKARFQGVSRALGLADVLDHCPDEECRQFCQDANEYPFCGCRFAGQFEIACDDTRPEPR